MAAADLENRNNSTNLAPRLLGLISGVLLLSPCCFWSSSAAAMSSVWPCLLARFSSCGCFSRRLMLLLMASFEISTRIRER